MALFRFNRTPKHQQYDYIPRYWDPQKEELEERLKRVEDRKKGDTKAMKARLSGGFKRGGGYQKGNIQFRRRQTRRSNITLLVVLIVLVFLTYLFINVYLPGIAAAVGE